MNAESAPEKGKKKRGVLGLVGTSLAGGLVALAVSYFDPFGSGAAAETEPTEHAEEHAETVDTHKAETKDKAKKAKKKTKGHGEAAGHAASDGAVIVPLDPLIVSLASADPRRRAPRLRLVVAIETDTDGVHLIEQDTPRLRDGFTAAVRGMETSALTAPGGLEALRAVLHDRAREVLGEETPRGILITDFITT